MSTEAISPITLEKFEDRVKGGNFLHKNIRTGKAEENDGYPRNLPQASRVPLQNVLDLQQNPVTKLNSKHRSTFLVIIKAARVMNGNNI
ncbi:2422_t:CDS:2 [Acaulospora morrowiae]|uniref:2422_t:CDS:1 n=1 Tax=Acaulospora morrowiae TaxID=94023 RepID=A0A9N9A393_9GLOM|nr:2422_t:CDS:2 [Acaulospora morrowiae]